MLDSKEHKRTRIRKLALKFLSVAAVCSFLYVLSFFGLRNYCYVMDMDSQGNLVSFKGYFFASSEKSNCFLHNFYRPLWKGLLGSKSSDEFSSINDLVDHAGRSGVVYFYDIELVPK